MSNVAQRSFGSGELAPFLYGRTDVQKYQSGLKVCRNFIVQKAGGLTNRPGTMFVTRTGGLTRLLAFVYNDAQSYLLVFTEGQITIVRDGGLLGVTVPTPYLAADLAALQVVQSGDVLTITHASYPPQELRRSGDLLWALAPVVLGKELSAPTGLTMTPAAPSGDTKRWVITAVAASGSESFASAPIGLGGTVPSIGARTITWGAVAGAISYNVYVSYLGGPYGYRGTSLAPRVTFSDGDDAPPDYERAPSERRDLFAGAGDYPAAVALYQQRRIFGGSDNAPETVWASRTGDYSDFTESTPIQDDDAITFTLAGRTVNRVRHLVDAESLLVFTDGAEKVATGDGAGTLTPTAIGLASLSRHGSSILPPLVLDDAVLYLQARQSIVRALRLSGDARPKADGADLTVYATHLFEGHTITAWAYQEVPNSILWCVRSDGVLLGLTYLPEQEMLAWHRHDTDGLIEQVCVLPEGTEDAVYLVVNRRGVRMLERMAARRTSPTLDAAETVFTDASLVYDGRNTGTTVLWLTGGSAWTYDDLVTLRASAPTFPTTGPSDVGNQYWLTGADGQVIRFTVDTVVNSTKVLGYANRNVPPSLREARTATWSRAVDSLAGLEHLEGRAVSVVAEGLVVANPNNDEVSTRCTVASGQIALPQAYPVLCVGLPIVADLQTLDLDSPSGASLKEKAALVKTVTVQLVDSTACFVGAGFPSGADPLFGLDELQIREPSDEYHRIAPRTVSADIGIESSWNSSGSIVLRHIDPLPLTVVGLIPRGHFPDVR